MKVKPLLYIAMLCMLGSGCRLSDNFFRTTVFQPLHYAIRRDDRQSTKHFRQLARDVLNGRSLDQCYDGPVGHALCALTPLSAKSWRRTFSVDYARGFEDGFVDFLDAGGTGQPPPVPPRRYWRAKYQTADGQLAIQQWFSGYEDGVRAAQASGYRDFVVIPVSDALVATTQSEFHGQLQTVQPAVDVRRDWWESDAMDNRPYNLFERVRRLPPIFQIQTPTPYEVLPGPYIPPPVLEMESSH
ncbi:MAG: hypothetical protein OES79_00735 [Planctomycetota bacterium]|nr:hypothetical protein [Planctomycetota bacterium]